MDHHDAEHRSRGPLQGQRLKGYHLGHEKSVIEMGIKNIILDKTELDRVAFRRIPFDPNGKPIWGGYEDSVSLGHVSFNIILPPE